jgi:hypothetical protein
MNILQRQLIIPLIIAATQFVTDVVRADNDDTAYKQTNLVSDGAVSALMTDPHLKNPWGIAALPG